jgi:antitoxin (DNA-binding transcriptional repressor) of toxin-antitoxin stability system
MKTLHIEQTTLDACVTEATNDRVLITRDGVPVALVLGVEGLDVEQVELASSEEFWSMIAERRRRPLVSRAELEAILTDEP